MKGFTSRRTLLAVIFFSLALITIVFIQRVKANNNCPYPFDECPITTVIVSSDSIDQNYFARGYFTPNFQQDNAKWIIDMRPSQNQLVIGSYCQITELNTGNIRINELYQGMRTEGYFSIEPTEYEIKLKVHNPDLLLSNKLLCSVDYKLGKELDPPDDLCKDASTFTFIVPFSTVGNIEFSGDNDWHLIQVTEPGVLVVTLNVPDEKDYQIEVFGNNCDSKIASSTQGRGMDERILLPVEPGLYRIHIFGEDIDDFGFDYTVTAAIDNPPPVINFKIQGGAPAGSDKIVLAEIQDVGSGLSTFSINCKAHEIVSIAGQRAEFDVNVPAFAPGTTEKVVIRGLWHGLGSTDMECGIWAQDMASKSTWCPFKGVDKKCP